MANVKKTENIKKEKKVAVVKVVKVETKPKADSVLSITAFDLTGKEAGSLSLPKEVFGQEVNTPLLLQAIRILTTNQKAHWSNTKTRGEVQGSTRKIFKQKGTGRARHGSITAPIFVGGGIALGPKSRKTQLDLPKKMKKAALISALSEKVLNKEIIGLTSIDKATGKTKELSNFAKKVAVKSLLLVDADKSEALLRASKNLKNITLVSVSDLNPLQVTRFDRVVLTQNAITALQTKLTKREDKEETK